MLTLKRRFQILSRDAFACQYCGRKAPGVVLEVDHKTPLSKGGTDHPSNLLTACWDCNRGKGAWEGGEPERVQPMKNGVNGWSFMRNWWYLKKPPMSIAPFYALAKAGLVTTSCCSLHGERNVLIHESGEILTQEEFSK